MESRSKGGVPVAILLIVGIAGIVRLSETPRFTAYRAVDVVQLIGSGVCFGVVLMWMVLRLRGKSSV
jgi:hypothetical protein